MNTIKSGGRDIEALYAVLTEKLDQQEQVIQAQSERIRKLETRGKWHPATPGGFVGWVVILLIVGFLFKTESLGLAQAGIVPEKETSGIKGDGANVVVAQLVAPSAYTSAPTTIYNPSGTELAWHLFRVNNYSNAPSNLTPDGSAHIAIVGTTSGIDSGLGTYKVGVLGMIDEYGYAVWGKVDGSGGTGVKGEATSGVGVYGSSTSSYGVWGLTNSGTGVYGYSNTQYGVTARGGLAPLYLMPASQSGAPTTGSHQMGELYVDSAGNLFFCTATGTPGMWAKLNLSTSYLPTITK